MHRIWCNYNLCNKRASSDITGGCFELFLCFLSALSYSEALAHVCELCVFVQKSAIKS